MKSQITIYFTDRQKPEVYDQVSSITAIPGALLFKQRGVETKIPKHLVFCVERDNQVVAIP